MKLHVGDKVIVTAGKDKGVQGKVTQVVPSKNKVVVEGANFYVRHIKKQGEREGQKVRKERALPVGNVAPLNPDTKKPDRIGYRIEEDGTKVRIFKKTGKVVKYE